MHGLSGGSKFGAFSARRLHSCAYIDEYFGSSRAFSKICPKIIDSLHKVRLLILFLVLLWIL